MKNYPTSMLEKYPAISDLEKRAQGRIPEVAWAYLSSGTGDELAVDRNRQAFNKIQYNPTFMHGEQSVDLSTNVLGEKYDLPFGIAPVGLSGLIWPGAEMLLAKTAKEYNIPYCLSTVATQTPETIGPISQENSWFQLYTPRKKEIRTDILKRAKQAGFKTLVVTADVPYPSRRERTKRAGLRTPPKLTAKFVWGALTNPAWTKQVMKHGLPKLKTVIQYAESKEATKVFEELRSGFGGTLSWEYLKELRDEWKGHLILKGITHPDDASTAIEIGVDAIVVSNHGGRQFDAVPPAIDVLPIIKKAVGDKTTLMFDSGIRSGLDIIKAYQLGAEYVFLGRGFLIGVAALGKHGAKHVCEILKEDLKANLLQLGIENMADVKDLKQFVRSMI